MSFGYFYVFPRLLYLTLKSTFGRWTLIGKLTAPVHQPRLRYKEWLAPLLIQSLGSPDMSYRRFSIEVGPTKIWHFADSFKSENRHCHFDQYAKKVKMTYNLLPMEFRRKSQRRPADRENGTQERSFFTNELRWMSGSFHCVDHEE